MKTIEQADALIREAEEALNKIAARRSSVLARLNGEAEADEDPASLTMAERMARAQDRLDPEAASKRLRTELNTLDDMLKEQQQILNRARNERDSLVRLLSSAEYVRRLKVLADAAQAARDAYAAVHEEAINVTGKMLGGMALPQVRNPNEALLAIIAQAEHAIARCQSTTGMDDRKSNPLLDLLNPIGAIRSAVRDGEPFTAVARFFR